MKRFDIQDPNLTLLDHYFLEASAGTGKTFAIEHVTARLIAEEGINLDEILIVTFTRAATRELKTRIHQTLKEKGITTLMDQAQIFTIHGFCHRMLTEYAFEAQQGFGLLSEEESDYRQILIDHIHDFFRTSLHPSEYSTSQIATALRWQRQDKEALVRRILSLVEKEGTFPQYPDFHTSYERYHAAHTPISLEAAAFFKKVCERSGAIKEPWKTQLQLLAKPRLTAEEFDLLIASDKSVLALLTEDNLSKKAPRSPTELYTFRDALLPVLEEASSPLCTVMRMARSCHQTARDKLEKHAVLAPDDILKKMAESLDFPAFCSKIRERYRAAIIDEFQDTDATQWQIFKTLFIDTPLPALYLVGDPKQSIYSFRSADIYTYLAAKQSIANHAHLDTNYRSDPQLIRALNSLFSKRPDWLSLPDASLPFNPVKHADSPDTIFHDTKSPIHFFIYEKEKQRERNWPSAEIEHSTFFPFIVQEIQALTTQGCKFSDCAVLVKDRYQAMRLKQFLEMHQIPTLSKSTQPLKETPSYTLMRFLLQALNDPTEIPIKRFLAHPLQPYTHHDLQNETLLADTIERFRALPDLHAALRELFQPRDLETYSDFMTLSELVLEHADRPLEFLETLDDTPRRSISDGNAVTIMTIHMSKGLEFNIVFALGVINRYTGKEDFIRHQKEWLRFDPSHPQCKIALQRLDAEKMRQLYVAFTRAKQRLYIPLLVDTKHSPIPLGQASPMELFAPQPEDSTYLKPQVLSPPPPVPPELHPPTKQEFTIPERYFHSYTSLAQSHPQPPVTVETPLPKGARTGVLLHELLETILKDNLSDHAISALLKKRLPSHFPYQLVLELILKVLETPLAPHSFSLRDVNPVNFYPEVEFLYPDQGNYIKGFIDLIFCHEGVYYIVDWKTNLLESYDLSSLVETMHCHDYYLQAKLYYSALCRYLNGKGASIGGAYYIFLRGLPEGILYLSSNELDNDIK